MYPAEIKAIDSKYDRDKKAMDSKYDEDQKKVEDKKGMYESDTTQR
jgi:hypothetical protein